MTMSRDDTRSEGLAGSLVPLAGVAGVALAVMGGQAESSIDVPRPFSDPILLVPQARVAKMGVIRNLASIVMEIGEGDELRFVREPQNLQDRWAISVLVPSGRQLGYVAADVNQILARLMDAGKRVYGKVTMVVPAGNLYRVEMEVYLDD